MTNVITRGLFFILSSAMIVGGIHAMTVVTTNPQESIAGFGFYTMILLPMVYSRMRMLGVSLWNLVLAVTPFTLFMLCVYLTFVTEEAAKSERIYVLK